MSSHEKSKEKELIPVILCAGEGTRYGKLTQNLPKPLIQLKLLNNESILSYLIKNLLSLHLKKVVIITGYLNEKIEFSVNLMKKDSNNKGKLVLIHSGKQYKKGPLFSLLSIVQNKEIYAKNNIFIIFPGDTIFEIQLLKEVFDFIYKRITVFTKPCIFFQEIYHLNDYLKIDKSNPKLVSIIESEDSKSGRIVKEIKKIDLNLISKGSLINLAVPILVFNFKFIKILHKLSESNPVGEIRETLNIYLKQNQRIISKKLNSKYKFYDIDTSEDLNYFNQIKKKEKGGQ
ncbi:MAG: sugar phosphate nucleotidyltransferase [Promethearchaeota archaeon]